MRRVGLLLAVLVLAGPADAQPGKKARRETHVVGRPVSAWVKDVESGKPDAVVPALNALMRAGPEARPAVPALVKLIQGEPSLVQVIAVLALAKVGPDAVPALRKAMDGKSPRGRELAARALGLIGDPAATPNLVTALTDGEAAVRRTAVASLRQLNARAAVPALKKALADKDAEARVEAAWAVWQIAGDASGLGALKAACAEKDEDVLTKALTALGAMGPKARDAGPAVAALLKQESTDLRFLAAQTHYRLTGGRDGLDVVNAGLTEESHEVRLKAAGALAAWADTKDGQELMPLLLLAKISGTAEGATALRREAATYAPPGALRKRVQDDPDAAVRWWAALGLLAGGAERALEDELILALRDASAAEAVLSVQNRDRAAPMLEAL
ncbi:MAG: HEAT repeat domain-containing protein, partial [Gemmataceae bacterium]